LVHPPELHEFMQYITFVEADLIRLRYEAGPTRTDVASSPTYPTWEIRFPQGHADSPANAVHLQRLAGRFAVSGFRLDMSRHPDTAAIASVNSDA